MMIRAVESGLFRSSAPTLGSMRLQSGSLQYVASLALAVAIGPAACKKAAPEDQAPANASVGTPVQQSVEHDWPMFRGDRPQTGVAAGSLTVPLKLNWTFNATEAITSSPVVQAGRVYVGSDDGNLYAVNQADGTLVWKFATEDSIEAPPMILDGVVYIGSSDYRFYAIDALSGKEKWRFEADEKILGGANWVDGPGGDKRIVFGCYDNILYCLNAADGSVAWKYETENYINGTPAVEAGRIVFGGCDSFLHVVNAADGTVNKHIALGEECYVAGSVGMAGGRVYLGHYGNAFVCIELASGETNWTYPSPRFPFFSAPSIGDDRVYFGGRDKQVHCVNRATGEGIWTFPTTRQVDSSPVLCDGKIVIGSGDGRLFVLDSATGSELWSYDLGKSIVSSPAVVDGLILIGCNDGGLYAFDPAKENN